MLSAASAGRARQRACSLRLKPRSVATLKPAACTQLWGRMLASWPVALNNCWPNTADFGAGTLSVFSLAYANGDLTPVSDGCNSVPSRRALGREASREFDRF